MRPLPYRVEVIESPAWGALFLTILELEVATASVSWIVIEDNDPSGINVSQMDVEVTEEDDAGATYQLTMVSEPAVDVTVELSGLAGSDVIAMPATVTFTPDDWDEPKTVKLTAGDDADRLDDLVTIEHSAVEPVRGLYEDHDIDSVRATVLDNDVPVRVSFEQVSYTVAESDDALTTDVQEDRVTIRVLLDTAPRRSVTVPIIPMLRGGATEDDYTGVPREVIFAGDETEQTFTFIANHDTDDDDEDSVLLTFGTLPEAVSEGDEEHGHGLHNRR